MRVFLFLTLVACFIVQPFALGTWEWTGPRWIERPVTTSPEARANLAMAFDSTRGLVVLFGGRNESWENYSDTWEYGPLP